MTIGQGSPSEPVAKVDILSKNIVYSFGTCNQRIDQIWDGILLLQYALESEEVSRLIAIVKLSE